MLNLIRFKYSDTGYSRKPSGQGTLRCRLREPEHFRSPLPCAAAHSACMKWRETENSRVAGSAEKLKVPGERKAPGPQSRTRQPNDLRIMSWQNAHDNVLLFHRNMNERERTRNLAGRRRRPARLSFVYVYMEGQRHEASFTGLGFKKSRWTCQAASRKGREPCPGD
jgi:hypothetical protein